MQVKKIINFLVCLLFSVLLIATPAWAINVLSGDQVELKTTSNLGVPLHRISSTSVVGRAADGTIAEVVGTANNNNWVEIKLPDGEERWIIEKYITRVISSEPTQSQQEELPSASQDKSEKTAIFPGLSGEALKSQLAAEYQVKNSLNYDLARDYMYSQLDNDHGIVRGIYSDYAVQVNPNSSSPRRDAFQGGINAEHSWPQSKGATGIAKSDLHSLFPARAKINSLRSSLPLTDIDDRQTNLWIIKDQEFRSIPSVSIDAYSESVASAFEPREEVKGNLARALFYFYTMYESQADASFFRQQKQTLCKWNSLDPLDAQEIKRSHAIALKQGNENPFVLDSTLVDRTYCNQ
ncbi:endonuclease [Umezakia ovalisporum]|jgi:endonuclease I|uniref:endonuclease n=1 Tax=Umezakia ovalisporum TaxID=75695 RepID=UPI002473F4F3|nr:endonuclease [Umezakia ovalisporum]MBI1240550.1 hypothetical protein [Nostoc sp. RI_552]MDH6086052.1 endonuclease [Umezakia ovalisporum TAC611]